MKGLAKALRRTPHMVSSKVGFSAHSTDVEFDHLNAKFEALDKLARQLVRESQTYLDAVRTMLSSEHLFSQEFSLLLHPLGTEYDLERRHPEVVQTLNNVKAHLLFVEELRETLRPEMDLIATRVVVPGQELEKLLKNVSKAITKRNHKLIDFDRHSNAYLKLKEKENRSSKDEQHLMRLETEFENATADYEHHNKLLKDELPQFMDMVGRMVTPLFYSLYYMQLNILYLTMERLQRYTSGKFDVAENVLTQREKVYEANMANITSRLEQFSIRKPLPPSARVLQMARSGQPLSKLDPMSARDMPTTASDKSAASKPLAPPADYVVALYDYTAQAQGDLTFRAGDRIEVVERTGSTEDWWTGRLNGVQGVFPGNYVRDQ